MVAYIFGTVRIHRKEVKARKTSYPIEIDILFQVMENSKVSLLGTKNPENMTPRAQKNMAYFGFNSCISS